MKRVIISILLWTLVIAWMGLIFSLSAQPAEVSKEVSKGTLEIIYDVSHSDADSSHEQKSEEFVDNNHATVRRMAHFCIFTVLGMLLTVASLYSFDGIKRFILPITIGLVYIFSDELHQMLVPERAFEWKDVLIDSLGMLLGCVFVYLIYWALFKRRK